MAEGYLHGYSDHERKRLTDQAVDLEEIIHANLDLTGVNELVELGCGTGGQLQVMRHRYPEMRLTGVDKSNVQLSSADELLHGEAQLIHADASDTGLPSGSFDCVFICWVLEHAIRPEAILKEAYRILRPGGRIIVTEVLNHSLMVHPQMPAIENFWAKYNEQQKMLQGQPDAGLYVGVQLNDSGFDQIQTRALPIHVDDRDKAQKTHFLIYFKELLCSAADGMIDRGLIHNEDVEAMRASVDSLIEDPHGIFYYNSIQAEAIKGEEPLL